MHKVIFGLLLQIYPASFIIGGFLAFSGLVRLRDNLLCGFVGLSLGLAKVCDDLLKCLKRPIIDINAIIYNNLARLCYNLPFW